jgi:NAD(P)-dependent dehydrogenase (short-subunit alcohol dehydrogenase family)
LTRYLNFPLPTIIETFLLWLLRFAVSIRAQEPAAVLNLSEEETMRLEDKVAIVTGAAHGMGEAEARLFAREGAKVVVADVLGEQAVAVAADIRAAGGEAIAATIDVTSEPAWVALIEKTVARYGRLDILVNNAGISGSSVGDPDGLEGWHRIIAVNQTSVFLGTKLAAEQMAKTGGGSIVNISSIMGFVGGASGHPAYSASKGAVRIYTKSAAVRYGPLGIRVNSVHPGYMPPMLNATNANKRADKIALTPLRRLGEPIEVAYGVLFLASDEASFVTGTELVIDGGYIAQ